MNYYAAGGTVSYNRNNYDEWVEHTSDAIFASTLSILMQEEVRLHGNARLCKTDVVEGLAEEAAARAELWRETTK